MASGAGAGATHSHIILLGTGARAGGTKIQQLHTRDFEGAKRSERGIEGDTGISFYTFI